MNKNIQNHKAKHRSRLSRQLLSQYVVTMLAFSIGVIVFLVAAWRYCSRFTWYESDPLYQLLSFIKDYILLFGGGLILAGWLWITYRFISKPLSYLDEIVKASEKLARPDAEEIVLPAELKNIQDELNLVRETALKNDLLAKEAEKRKNDLIVYLAHDLKTPLTSVIGYLTLLHDEPDLSVATRARFTQIALDKALRLEELINEFFDITRFSLSSLVLETRRINISYMLEQITSEFDPLLLEKGLSWQKDIEENVEIICDPDKMERVFDNLIRNAIYYSYEKSVIAIQLIKKEENVEIRFENAAKTIPQDKLERIFEQFFRLDAARSTSNGNAGLGLAIAKEIVELHHGRIQAESKDEKICFTVILPL